MGRGSVKPILYAIPGDRGRRAFAVAALVAGAVFSGGAFAADLPSRKGVPAEGLRVCNVAGMAGFLIPGTDTCLKVGGYVSSEVLAGSLSPQYGLYFTGIPGESPVTSETLSPRSRRDSSGFAVWGQLDFDLRQPTSYGLLRAYAEILSSNASGFDSPGSQTLLNLGYVQFAGLTAGKIGSFFAYLGGGSTWYDFYSPDRVNGNQPNVLAYTANFNAGMSATISLEEPAGANVNNGINGGFNNSYYGERYPDVVAALKVQQGWGSAQLAGVAHNTSAIGVSGDTINHWGGAVLAGATVNLPALGAGDRIGGQVVASSAALGYSGIVNTVQSPYDQGFNFNGNGTIFQLTDALNYDVGRWSMPTTWSIATYFEHYFSSQFIVIPEISIANVRYSGSPSMISTSATSVLGGAIAHWIPVPHLDFQFEVMYQDMHQSTPASYVGPQSFVGHSNGVAGALSIVRDF